MVLITLSLSSCEVCEKVFSTYKKAVSYMASEKMKIKFGMIDIATDQVDIPQLKAIPSVLFYGKDKENPTVINPSSFEIMMQEIRNVLGERNNDL